MKLFDTVNTETALFVTADKASNMCEAALNRWPIVLRDATYRRRYIRGALAGYVVTLKFSGGATSEMSESIAEELLKTR